MSDTVMAPALGKHGAIRLPAVDVDSYTLELKRDIKRWGVLTIGTGLGNARFTNRAAGKE